MSEIERRPAPDADGAPLPGVGPVTDAVARTDLHRSRQHVRPADPDAVRFAGRLARAIDRAPAPAPVGVGAEPVTDPAALRVAPAPGIAESAPHRAVRDAVFGGPTAFELPAVPALLCDASGRVLRANPEFAALAGSAAAGGRDPGPGPLGQHVSRLLVGPDHDARLVRADGTPARVRVVRWPFGGGLQAVVLIELGDGDERRIAELERMARVGTWTFDLATASLQRSESLADLYRSAGVDPDRGTGPLEGEQVALLCQGLRTGHMGGDHHVDLRLPGERLLSCRARVERADDGTAVRLVGTVRDMSAQRRVEDRHRSAGRRFADLMALAPAGVAVLDRDGRVLDANPALSALLDTPPERLRGTPAAELCAEPGWLRPLSDIADGGYRIDALPLLRGDGTRVWCQIGVTRTQADDGAPLHLVVVDDIDDRRRAAEVLRSAGTVDPLTRLFNRAAALDLVDRLIAGPGRDGVVVVCGDLDDFARVNSALGHEAGDDLLVALAGRLQRELPFGCTAARLSGDEFLVVCADHTEADGPEGLARTVAGLLRTTVPVHGRPVEVTASVGVAVPTADPDARAADLLRYAEVAMHEAKRSARGGVGMADARIVASATGQLALEAELRAAIADDRLAVQFQPVVGADGRIGSAEALVRWPHPERGLIPPGEFLPVAQRGGLMRELDVWVLRTSAAAAAGWPAPADGAARAAVAVNLAGLLPGDAGFVEVVTDAVERAGLAWDRLILELVETAMVALPPHALAEMDALAARGVRFAVDDFGTGYSSLARLKELPAQIVKVDRAFVTGVAADPADFAVARAVVDMARAMGRRTVAEGVETAEQFEALRRIGVDAYQGWLFARALGAGDMVEALRVGRLPVPPSTGAA